MNFISVVMDGECPICLLEFGNDAMVHEDGAHAIHRRCLEVWIQAQKNMHQPPSCPHCRQNINSIENKGEALIRMARHGDEVAIKAFVKNGPFPHLRYELAISMASLKGHHKVVEALLENGSISNEACGLALEKAVVNNDPKTVEILLNKRQMRYESIPFNALEKCLNIAKEKGYEDIIAQLKPIYELDIIFSVERYSPLDLQQNAKLEGHVDRMIIHSDEEPRLLAEHLCLSRFIS